MSRAGDRETKAHICSRAKRSESWAAYFAVINLSKILKEKAEVFRFLSH